MQDQNIRGTWGIHLPVTQMVAEYRAGVSVIKLAARYGVSRQIVYLRLWAAGVKFPPRKKQIVRPRPKWEFEGREDLLAKTICL